MGKGGFGTVYKIEDQNGNKFAYKHVEISGSKEAISHKFESLKREYGILSKLKHERIIQVIDCIFNNNGELFLIMEFLPGDSLEDKISRMKKLDIKTSLKITGQILEGVVYLHEKELLHCDIKPANIMFTAHGDVKLCDFGISVHLETVCTTAIEKQFKDIYYSSPERLRGKRKTKENDIWSVGATFVTMITGVRLNNVDPKIVVAFNISEYKITYAEGKTREEFLKGFKQDLREVIDTILSKTICFLHQRSTAKDLLTICNSSLSKV